MQRPLIFIVLALILMAIGCGPREKPATLIVHYHDGLYDFIDHDGIASHTSLDIDDFKLVIKRTHIQKLIVRQRVVLRFAGVGEGDGFDMPDEVVLALAELTGIGVARFDFDYTND